MIVRVGATAEVLGAYAAALPAAGPVTITTCLYRLALRCCRPPLPRHQLYKGRRAKLRGVLAQDAADARGERTAK